jgi:catechol 2,3-dioxygenase-like lactoylglutathione lyase family enzyme
MAIFRKYREIVDKLESGLTALAGGPRIFAPSGQIVVDVVDVEAARLWYSDKLGLRYSSREVEEATMALAYEVDDRPLVCLCQVVGNQRPNFRPGHPPILFAKKLDEAHVYLSSRGVHVGPLQSDSGGNRFFRFRDGEGNEIEVCQRL